MCCFSGAPRGSWLDRLLGPLAGRRVRVSETSIFARMVGPGTQVLVYSMKLSVGSDVAMILPVPTDAAAGEDALTFVDLSKHPAFFDDMAELFVPPAGVRSAGERGGGYRAPEVPKLAVHEVGSFVASFVPHKRDFGRLEERFRLADGIWDALPDARDYGFAVFQLGRGAHRIHPMAFRFRTRLEGRLFFPTVHVHDGKVRPEAKFDHALYFQARERAGATRSFLAPASDYEGVVVRGERVLRREIRGRMPNRDTFVAVDG